MLTYLEHLRHLRDETDDANDRVILDALIAEAEAEAEIEFDQAGHTLVNGERATRQRYEVPGG